MGLLDTLEVHEPQVGGRVFVGFSVGFTTEHGDFSWDRDINGIFANKKCDLMWLLWVFMGV